MRSVTAQCVRKSAGRPLRPVEGGTGGLQDNKACLTKLQNRGKQDLHGQISSVSFFLNGEENATDF